MLFMRPYLNFLSGGRRAALHLQMMVENATMHHCLWLTIAARATARSGPRSFWGSSDQVRDAIKASLAFRRALVSRFDRVIDQIYPLDFKQHPAAHLQVRQRGYAHIQRNTFELDQIVAQHLGFR